MRNGYQDWNYQHKCFAHSRLSGSSRLWRKRPFAAREQMSEKGSLQTLIADRVKIR